MFWKMQLFFMKVTYSGNIALTGFAPQFDRLTAAPKSPEGGAVSLSNRGLPISASPYGGTIWRGRNG
jgi:hypothetical protein